MINKKHPLKIKWMLFYMRKFHHNAQDFNENFALRRTVYTVVNSVSAMLSNVTI